MEQENIIQWRERIEEGRPDIFRQSRPLVDFLNNHCEAHYYPSESGNPRVTFEPHADVTLMHEREMQRLARDIDIKLESPHCTVCGEDGIIALEILGVDLAAARSNPSDKYFGMTEDDYAAMLKCEAGYRTDFAGVRAARFSRTANETPKLWAERQLEGVSDELRGGRS